MKIRNTKEILKSLTRGAVIVAGALTVALNTWTHGHTFGLNKETLLGVLGTAAFPIITTASRYLDKSDPALGLVSDAAARGAIAKIAAATGAIPN
jgi:hypothetical protein